MTDLPPGWEWTTLGEIGEWFGGGTPSKSNPGFWMGGAIPWLSPKDMVAERLTQTRDRITSAAVEESATRLVPNESVAIVVRSGILERRLPVAEVPFETTLNQDMRAVITYSGIDTSWVAHYLRSVEREVLTVCSKRGTTVASIDVPKLMQFRIPVPPTEEQRRIVAALEDHLSHITAGEDQLSTARQRQNALRNSVASGALRGELATSHSGDTPVDKFIDATAERRRQTVNSRRQTPVAISHEMESLKPTGWALTSLDSLCWDIQYGTSAKTLDQQSGRMIPVIRMGNIQDGHLLSSPLKYLPEDHPSITGLRLRDGDVLFNRTNSLELVGKSAVYRQKFGPATFASYLIRCRLLPGINPDWIALVINSPMGREYIRRVASQQVGQANVNGTKLAAMPIPLPSPEEQDRIVLAVNELTECAEHSLTSLSTATGAARQLRRSLLTEAFAGRLVPQDPSDAPASVLLERIRAVRAAAPKPTRRRRKKTEIGQETSQ